MPVIRIPLVGQLSSRQDSNTLLHGTSQKDQYFKDCCFQIVANPVTGKAVSHVLGRNDYEANSSDLTGAPVGGPFVPGTAVRYWRGHSSPGNTHLISCFGDAVSDVFEGTTYIDTLSGGGVCEHINETSISGVSTILFQTSGIAGFYYPEGGAITEITDTDFPPKQTPALTMTGNFAVLDGFTFVMCTNGQIWHSDVNSVVNWTSTASITAQEYPDNGVAVARYRNFIVAFSKGSVEFFVNRGNATGSVLGRVQHMARKVGLVNQHALVEYKDTLCWIGSSSGTAGVYMLVDGEPVKISTGEIDWSIENRLQSGTFPAIESVRLNLLVSWGKVYLAMHLPDSLNLLVYDFELKLWTYWVLTDSIYKSDCPELINTNDACFYVGGSQLYVLKNSNSVVSGELQTALIDLGSFSRKTCSQIRFIGDRTSDAMNLSVSWSDDDYQTFNTPRTVNMQSAVPVLYRCGMFRRRALKITGIGEASADKVARLEAIELVIQPSSLE